MKTVESYTANPLGVKHWAEVIDREAETHVFHQERLDVAKVEAPGRQWSSIHARTLDGSIGGPGLAAS